eukprot:TRINITY_DN51642_c0_g1_i1.p1 TRINITY_DN51642_c0_g1~~TRINITY_DN51642_c0_g1_i1.p1  ORF type:complete len:372 (+),score=31.55 TRINITY_DN51642_c0_g1_i1:135-1250(+)
MDLSNSRRGWLSVDPLQHHDSHVRYQMPPVEVKTESCGNGAKIVLPNLDKIAPWIYRSPDAILHFLKCDLAVASEKGSYASETKYILKGRFSPEQVQASLYKFVVQYVLCHSCRNPETRVEPAKKKKAPPCLVCHSCGSTSQLDDTPTAKLLAREHQPAPEKGKGKGKRGNRREETVDAVTQQLDALAAEANKIKISDTDDASAFEGLTSEDNNENSSPTKVLAALFNGEALPTSHELRDVTLDLEQQHGLADKEVVQHVFEALFAPQDSPIGKGIEDIPDWKERVGLAGCIVRSGTERCLLNCVLRFCNMLDEEAQQPAITELLTELHRLDRVSQLDLVGWYESKVACKGMPKGTTRPLKEKAKPFLDSL